ncbi:hypothetical protein E2C06_33265 [Dankookia rubra]|uniref:Uncharacterized protein n=1 Tax=Dankookia rubra TaxID=1442381 RepID=A0A4R5Q619_9PROT|nr:hypothetical protein [Dankookia rubra]TDH58314.1 hypothetical protein E2C06_33265 [Dankookia rubra]
MDDLDHAALACDGTALPRGDMQELLILVGEEGSWRRHTGKDAIGFRHVAPDKAGATKQQ